MSLLARLGVFLVTAGVLLTIWSGPAQAATIQVNIADNLFCGTTQPCVTNISVGDTVHWVWTGSNPHSTTSDVAGWDSGTHNNGFTFDHTFSTAGSFAYHCNIHPNMHGTIVVTQPVGGIAELPNVAGASEANTASSNGDTGLVAGISAAAAGGVALAGAALYVRKRRTH